MRILIAEDDPISRRVLEMTLRKWGHEVVVATDGREAAEAALRPDAPSLAVLDWMMPGMDGLDVCRLIRSGPAAEHTYIIMLTARESKNDIIAGLEAGADDYVTKPFDHGELQARLKVGQRILDLQTKVSDRVKELEDALSRVKTLHGLLPICSYCKKIRGDADYWHQVDGYISTHSDVRFSHGICPDCMEGVVKQELESFRAKLRDSEASPSPNPGPST